MTLLYRCLTNRLKQSVDFALANPDLLFQIEDFIVNAFLANIGAVKGAVVVMRAGHKLSLTYVCINIQRPVL